MLVLTVDLQTPGRALSRRPLGHDRQRRLAAQIAQGDRRHRPIPAWLWDVDLHGRPHSFGNLASAIPKRAQPDRLLAWIGANFDPSMTWKDMDEVREIWDGPIVIKGVLDVPTTRATRSGAARGHGGLQPRRPPARRGAPPSPPCRRIVDAVGDQTEVLMDGGVRSGLDVLKALSLGAKACLIGRAWAFALAAGGEAGVSRRPWPA